MSTGPFEPAQLADAFMESRGPLGDFPDDLHEAVMRAWREGPSASEASAIRANSRATALLARLWERMPPPESVQRAIEGSDLAGLFESSVGRLSDSAGRPPVGAATASGWDEPWAVPRRSDYALGASTGAEALIDRWGSGVTLARTPLPFNSSMSVVLEIVDPVRDDRYVLATLGEGEAASFFLLLLVPDGGNTLRGHVVVDRELGGSVELQPPTDQDLARTSPDLITRSVTSASGPSFDAWLAIARDLPDGDAVRSAILEAL